MANEPQSWSEAIKQYEQEKRGGTRLQPIETIPRRVDIVVGFLHKYVKVNGVGMRCQHAAMRLLHPRQRSCTFGECTQFRMDFTNSLLGSRNVLVLKGNFIVDLFITEPRCS